MLPVDGDPCECPFCRGTVPSEVIERIKVAAAGPMSGPMTLDEFKAWLAAYPDPAA